MVEKYVCAGEYYKSEYSYTIHIHEECSETFHLNIRVHRYAPFVFQLNRMDHSVVFYGAEARAGCPSDSEILRAAKLTGEMGQTSSSARVYST